MADGGGSTTSLTLLGRLRLNPGDQDAWGEFVDRYGRKVYAWCRRWGHLAGLYHRQVLFTARAALVCGRHVRREAA